MPMINASLISELIASQPEVHSSCLEINLKDACYRVHSNSETLLQELADYFGNLSVWSDEDTNSDKTQTWETIFIFESSLAEELIAATDWQDWKREAGKSGRKDAVYDLDTAHGKLRLLYKVKTGMLFLQPARPTPEFPLMAFGPAEKHPNQIINFILTQYLNRHIRSNWLLGHAAGLQIKQQGVAIAGLSGGGKSTLMLHLLEEGEHFISNDRLLFKADAAEHMLMRGIPKQPRINPGTIVHNPRLHSLISEQQRSEFLAMPQEALRALEMKFDAPVDRLYWENCYVQERELDWIVILNWQAVSNERTQVHRTTLQESPHLIPALVKSPGPFYSDASGEFLKNGLIPNPLDYQQALGKVPVLELTGKIDFTEAKSLILDQLNQSSENL
ncbi:HprK-related kinase B [Thiomicrorhabdus xiamenensis]|uniref:HprK-related kinase B n=1 Tax=Thiomicrorhabdus xiamenensis TaxID=2739063 RepID=A0A7D4NM98_9GAMM|nr:HprK-related kinase B [Thiomicrorhabdus xiamenensis]QKI89874.1 HprK-related kinase B [Thiomicrorhabdus xiamenensis]